MAYFFEGTGRVETTSPTTNVVFRTSYPKTILIHANLHDPGSATTRTFFEVLDSSDDSTVTKLWYNESERKLYWQIAKTSGAPIQVSFSVELPKYRWFTIVLSTTLSTGSSVYYEAQVNGLSLGRSVYSVASVVTPTSVNVIFGNVNDGSSPLIGLLAYCFRWTKELGPFLRYRLSCDPPSMSLSDLASMVQFTEAVPIDLISTLNLDSVGTPAASLRDTILPVVDYGIASPPPMALTYTLLWYLLEQDGIIVQSVRRGNRVRYDVGLKEPGQKDKVDGDYPLLRVVPSSADLTLHSTSKGRAMTFGYEVTLMTGDFLYDKYISDIVSRVVQALDAWTDLNRTDNEIKFLLNVQVGTVQYRRIVGGRGQKRNVESGVGYAATIPVVMTGMKDS